MNLYDPTVEPLLQHAHDEAGDVDRQLEAHWRERDRSDDHTPVAALATVVDIRELRNRRWSRTHPWSPAA